MLEQIRNDGQSLHIVPGLARRRRGERGQEDRTAGAPLTSGRLGHWVGAQKRPMPLEEVGGIDRQSAKSHQIG